jgi:cobalt-zinc-cadmium efflux system membrane fusion protein
VKTWTGLILPVALAVAGCGEKAAPPAKAARDPMAIEAGADLQARVRLAQPRHEDVRETLRVPARIEADETRMARVGAPVAGRITDLAATIGQDVRRGQVLATINSTELSTAQLAYIRSQSQRQIAARAAARAQQLHDADVIAAVELQRRQNELTLADAEVGATRDQLKVLGMSQGALNRLADTRTINSVAQIVASVSGTVIERKVTEGQVVQPADTVYVVADLSRIWVVADIPEQSAGLVSVGESVAVEIPALPERRIPGALSFVSPIVSPETRTVRARIDLSNADREYKPAMLASMLIRGKAQRRLTVPVAAVVREENRDYVFVQAAPGRYVLKPVSLGTEYEERRAVTSGLAAEDQVVVEGAFHLNNERKRRLLDAQ